MLVFFFLRHGGPLPKALHQGGLTLGMGMMGFLCLSSTCNRLCYCIVGHVLVKVVELSLVNRGIAFHTHTWRVLSTSHDIS